MTAATLIQAREWITIPTAPAAQRESAPTHVVDGPIRGLRVGMRSEGDWRSWLTILAEWEMRLNEDGAIPVRITAPQQRVGQAGADVQERVAAWADSVDCGVSGLGTCGSCTLVSTDDAVTLESAGKPTVLAVTAEFAQHARNMSTFRGHANMKLLVFPHPLEGRDQEDLRAIAHEYYPKFLQTLGVHP